MRKTVLFVVAAALAATVVIAVWWKYSAQKDMPFTVENGRKRRMTADEVTAFRRQQPIVPGVSSPTVPPNAASPDVRRSMETINQVNSINQLNKKQK
jgi:hypothetical protein